MQQPAVKRETTAAAAKATATAMAVGGTVVYMLCVHEKICCFGKKGILQCVTKWMAKTTVPVTIWVVFVWKGGGRQKKSHLGTLRYKHLGINIYTKINHAIVSQRCSHEGTVGVHQV